MKCQEETIDYTRARLGNNVEYIHDRDANTQQYELHTQ